MSDILTWFDGSAYNPCGFNSIGVIPAPGGVLVLAFAGIGVMPRRRR